MFKFNSKLPSAVIAIVLTVALLFSVAVPTFAFGTASVGSVAEDIDGKEIVGQDVDQGKQTEYSDGIAVEDSAITENCDVYATVPDSGIVVTVPKVQILDGKSAAANVGVYTVAVRGDISATTVINVEPQDEMEDRDGVNFEMTSAGKAGIPTDVDQAKTMFTYADGVRPDTPATTTGTITAHGMTAGIWNGDFMFNISAGIKDETTYYTIEEIEADPTMFMIGATNPEYVVADFNDDFTEVVITRNGANSDGVMALLVDVNAEEFKSPMTLNADTLKKASVKAGVVNIGMGAFVMCQNLESVNMSNSITSIDDAAFGYCSGLEHITIPDSVTTLGNSAFYDCDNLANVALGNGVTEIGAFAFYDCDSLENIVIPNSTTVIGEYVFEFCDSLANIVIPNSTTVIGEYAFSGCTNLQTAVIGSGVTELKQGTFANCKSLTIVKLSEGLEIIGKHAFLTCTSLYNIFIPNSVTNIDSSAFAGNVGFNITIQGTFGSYAQSFANTHGYGFVAV